MTVETLAQRLLADPSSDDLWQLHPYLLTLATPEADAARDVAGKFYAYLNCVRSKLTSKQYSTLAAMLAAGSVGAFSAQEMINALKIDRQNALRYLLVGGLAEMLEVFSTVQHVKAWEVEFASMHEEVVWNLYAQWWRLSVEMQPDLVPAQRHVLIESLLVTVRDAQMNSLVRMAITFRLFQVLLIIRLAPLFSDQMLATRGVE